MSASELKELLEQEPFEPICIRVTSGDAYEIRNAHLAVAMKTRLFIAESGSDRWTLIPYLHISAIERLSNGHGAGRGKRKGR